MTLVTKETLAGVLITSTSQRRTQVRNRIEAYLNRPRVNVVPSSPLLIDENTGKYGTGFGLVARAEFVARVDADEVWADLAANALSVIESGSFIDQYTSREDQATGLNETTYVHRRHFPPLGGDF